jgi:hypothetical protein
MQQSLDKINKSLKIGELSVKIGKEGDKKNTNYYQLLPSKTLEFKTADQNQLI